METRLDNFTRQEKTSFSSSQLKLYRRELSKKQIEFEKVESYFNKLKKEYSLNETVIDAESRLSYSKLKDEVRSNDVAALQEMLGIPQKLEYEMADDCKLQCLMRDVQVN